MQQFRMMESKNLHNRLPLLLFAEKEETENIIGSYLPI